MKVRFGIIGYGKIGERHAAHIDAHPDANLHGAFDTDPSRNYFFQSNYPKATAFPSLKDLLSTDEIDIVSVCTPNSTHAPIAIESIKAGKHVLVEKPMCLTRQEADEMIATANIYDRHLFVVKQNRFNPPVATVKKLIDEGRLGKIYSASLNCYWNRNEKYYTSSSWKGTRQYDGGTLFTQFSHFIDVLFYLLGPLEVVSANLINAAHQGLIEFEDTGVVSFMLTRHQSPAVLHYTTAAYNQNMEGSLTIFAENATIRIGGKYLNIISYQATNGFEITAEETSGSPNQYGDYEGSMSNHDKVIDNVIKTLQGSESIMTNADDGKFTVGIIEDVYRVANFSHRV